MNNGDNGSCSVTRYNTSSGLQNLFPSVNIRRCNMQVKRMQPVSYGSAIKDPVINKYSALCNC